MEHNCSCSSHWPTPQDKRRVSHWDSEKPNPCSLSNFLQISNSLTSFWYFLHLSLFSVDYFEFFELFFKDEALFCFYCLFFSLISKVLFFFGLFGKRREHGCVLVAVIWFRSQDVWANAGNCVITPICSSKYFFIFYLFSFSCFSGLLFWKRMMLLCTCVWFIEENKMDKQMRASVLICLAYLEENTSIYPSKFLFLLFCFCFN